MKNLIAAVLLLIGAANALRQPQTGILKGRIVDSARAPISRAVVIVRAMGVPEMRLSADRSGQFSTTLQPRTYRVCVSSQGFEEVCQSITVVAGTTANIETILRPAASNIPEPDVDATPHVVPTEASQGAQASLPVPDLRVRVSSGILDLLAVKKMLPQPPWSREHGHEKGVVTVAVLVDYDGTVKTTSLLSGDPVLGGVAMGAIKQWEFKLYVINGQRVQVESHVVINFGKKRASLVLSHRKPGTPSLWVLSTGY